MQYNWIAEKEYFEGRESDISGHPDDLYPSNLLDRLKEKFRFWRSKIIVPVDEPIDQEFQHKGTRVTLAGAHRSVGDPREIRNRVPPWESQLAEIFQQRQEHGRDLVVLYTARDAARGTGKSTLAVIHSKYIDKTWSAEHHATVDPEEFVTMYENLPAGRVILLDEAEQVSARKSQSKQNIEISDTLAAKRYKKHFTLMTLPSPELADINIRRMASIRIHVLRRGVAKVQKLKVQDNPPYNHYVKNLERVHWQPIDDDKDFQKLSRMKEERFSGDRSDDDDTPNLSEEDVEEAREKELERNIRRLYEETSMSQSQIADALSDKERSVSQSKISRIINE